MVCSPVPQPAPWLSALSHKATRFLPTCPWLVSAAGRVTHHAGPGVWAKSGGAAGAPSMLKVVAGGSQCEEVEKWGQSASQLPPSQAVGDDMEGRKEVLLRREVEA